MTNENMRFGERQRALPRHVEREALLLLDCFDLGSLYLASHDMSKLVIRFLKTTPRVSVCLCVGVPHARSCAAKLPLRLLSDYCGQLRTFYCCCTGKPCQDVLDWFNTILERNRQFLQRVNVAERFWTSEALSNLFLCPRLQDLPSLCYGLDDKAIHFSESDIRRISPEHLPDLRVLNLHVVKDQRTSGRITSAQLETILSRIEGTRTPFNLQN